MKDGAGGWTQCWVAPARTKSATGEGAWVRLRPRTRLGVASSQSVGDASSLKTANKLQLPCKTSGCAAIYGVRSGAIRKKIIGRGMRVIAARAGFGKQVRGARGTFALLQKQPRQHSGRIFFLPIIEQRDDFLSQIGGVREAGQFVALQGTARSGEQKIPRWLRRAGGHRPPFGGR